MKDYGIKELEERMDNLLDCIFEMIKDYKRINLHRHQHMKGMTDNHTKYKSIESHIEALGNIMKRILKDIKEFRANFIETNYKLQNAYMYQDADEDIRIDAEISYKETMEELGLEVR